MKTMVHPNGCVHNVRDDLVEKFTKAGWKVKAADNKPPKKDDKPKKDEEPKKDEDSETT